MRTSIRHKFINTLSGTIILCLTFLTVNSEAWAAGNQLTKNNPIITERLATNLKSYYGREAQALTINGKFCREDASRCVLTHEPFDVVVYGRGVVDVKPLARMPLADNVEMCALVLNTLTGTPMADAVQAVGIVFGAASQRGSFNQKVSGAKVTVTANSTSDLGAVDKLIDPQSC